jgi:hypothetical protein
METEKKQWQIESKRNNQFVVEFPKQFGLDSYSVKRMNKPNFINNRWGNIRIDFTDVIGGSSNKGLLKIINFLKLSDGINPLFDIKIKMLNSIGNVVEEWVISVEKVLTIDFGDLDYGDDSIQEPYLIFKPLDCILI